MSCFTRLFYDLSSEFRFGATARTIYVCYQPKRLSLTNIMISGKIRVVIHDLSVYSGASSLRAKCEMVENPAITNPTNSWKQSAKELSKDNVIYKNPKEFLTNYSSVLVLRQSSVFYYSARGCLGWWLWQGWAVSFGPGRGVPGLAPVKV